MAAQNQASESKTVRKSVRQVMCPPSFHSKFPLLLRWYAARTCVCELLCRLRSARLHTSAPGRQACGTPERQNTTSTAKITSSFAVDTLWCFLQLQPHRGGGKAARRQQGDGGDDGATGLQYSGHNSSKTRNLGSHNGWLQWSKLTPVSGRSLPFQTVFVEPCWSACTLLTADCPDILPTSPISNAPFLLCLLALQWLQRIAKCSFGQLGRGTELRHSFANRQQARPTERDRSQDQSKHLLPRLAAGGDIDSRGGMP